MRKYRSSGLFTEVGKGLRSFPDVKVLLKSNIGKYRKITKSVSQTRAKALGL